MIIRFNKTVVATTVLTHGVDNRLSVCMEEPAELIQAISKILRWKTSKQTFDDELAPNRKLIENLTEEMADVLIIIEELKYICNISDDDLQKWVEKKQARQIKRNNLNKEENHGMGD